MRTSALATRFAKSVARGALRPDAGQERAAGSLDELRQKILNHTVQVGEYQTALAVWGDKVAELREQQRLSEVRERERIANLPFYQQWMLRLREMQAGVARSPSPSPQLGDRSTAGCSSGGCEGGEGACAAPAAPEVPAGLDGAELQHPFWRTGLGSRALLRAGVLPTAGPGPASAETPASAASAADEEELPPGAPPMPARPAQPEGLFLHGSVGAGKTMLMDWFAEAVAEDVRRPSVPPSVRCSVRRVHYNAFMIECHPRLHHHTLARRGGAAAARREGQRGWSVMGELVRLLTTEAKPEEAASLSEALASISTSILDGIPEVQRAAPGDAPEGAPKDSPGDAPGDTPEAPLRRPVTCGVLCFDEVQVMDVGDAAILTGVLERLFQAGWVLVATCNRVPADFETSHTHREHPQARFAAQIQERCELIELAPTADYRRALAAAAEPSFFTPLDGRSAAAVEARFAQLSRGAAVPTEAAVAFGRKMPLLACRASGVARLSFEEACGGHYGAADYIALAQAYHTLVLTDVPRMSLHQRDKARRFIVFIDQLYNHKTRLIASAAVPVEELFSGAAGWRDDGATLEGLEFEGEAGKAAELNPIGVTANALSEARPTGNVSADSRKGLAVDTLFSGEDETFAFTRAISRLCEMQSSAYLEARARESS